MLLCEAAGSFDASGVGLAGAGLSDGLAACAAKLPFADLSGRAARKLAG